MKAVVTGLIAMMLASSAFAQPDLSQIQRSWKNWSRQANAEAKSVRIRLQASARRLERGWDALEKSEQVRLAKELWALRQHINMLALLGSDETSKMFGLDTTAIRTLQSALKFASTMKLG
ncbi:hypothetical protein MCEMSE15_02308 [Fimbriimonadaceae bacterium]